MRTLLAERKARVLPMKRACARRRLLLRPHVARASGSRVVVGLRTTRQLVAAPEVLLDTSHVATRDATLLFQTGSNGACIVAACIGTIAGVGAVVREWQVNGNRAAAITAASMTTTAIRTGLAGLDHRGTHTMAGFGTQHASETVLVSGGLAAGMGAVLEIPKAHRTIMDQRRAARAARGPLPLHRRMLEGGRNLARYPSIS